MMAKPFSAIQQEREATTRKPDAFCSVLEASRQVQTGTGVQTETAGRNQASSLRSQTNSTGNASASFPRSGSHSKEQGNQMQQRRRHEQKMCNMPSAMRFAASGNNRRQEMLFMPAASVCTAKSGAVKTCGKKETNGTINMRVCLHQCKLRKVQHAEAITNAKH